MYDIFLFDLDGTLTDPKEGIVNCVKYALEHFDITENREDVLNSFIGPPLVDSFMSIYNMSKEDADIAVSKYRERYSVTGLFENRVLEGAEELLKELKENGKIVALATSKPQVFARKILENYKLIKYFDCVVGAEFDGTRNYKVDVIKEVFNQTKPSDFSKVVMIGDRKYDILAAKECGISAIGLECGYAEKDELKIAGADFVFQSIPDLKKFLVK